ncbi:VOC family protein [Nitratireductor kimnyeongensis]|uniref:VOC family protein n=1 Tax=Nitratireductor kimnyeongensis TaxID=430679 RepID=A0ABW0TAL1_9HYPH|nr:VOC family protein [Nitratireductor kimnyeongensis]QZZ36733.1 VOC family protein [Nitratireductor kimnyeongensis]
MADRRIALTTLVVRDYDEAIAWYREKLAFQLLEDTPLSPDKRWVVIAPQRGASGALLLARAASEEQEAAIGNQAGGRVFLFLHTDNFWRDYHAMREAGVAFHQEPREEAYGTVAVFSDLHGNLWDLLEPKSQLT